MSMKGKGKGEQMKVQVVAFRSHGGTVAGEINRTDHVASTPFLRQNNLSNTTITQRPPSKMSVVINPSRSLGFRRPLTQVGKRQLTITNPNSLPVAFKVKTTAPKLYCVRPNSGRVEPGDTVEVSVMLQPMKEEPPLNQKCKDKFLVQSTFITTEKETTPLQDLWTNSSGNEDGNIFQQKLRVVYLPAEGQPLEEEEEPHAPGPARNDTATSEFHQAYDTVKTHSVTNGHPHPPIPEFNEPGPSVRHTESHQETATEAPAPVPVPTPVPARAPVPPVPEERYSRELSREEVASESKEISQEVPILEGTTLQSPPPPTFRAPHADHDDSEPLPVPPPVQVPRAPSTATVETVYVENPLNEDLLAKYKEAQAEIERLRASIATMSVAPLSEVRSRRRTMSDAASTADTDVQTVVEEHSYHPQEGVPLPVVIIVSLAVFITTYLFF